MFIRLIILLALIAGPVFAQDYRAYFTAKAPQVLDRFYKRSDAMVDAGHVHSAAMAAACETRLWQLTGDTARARSATERLRSIAALLGKPTEANFFVPYPLTWTYRALDAGHMLDEPLKVAMQDAVAKSLRARDFQGLHNQTLQRAAGLGLAAQTWPDLPQAKAWRSYLETIFALLAKTGDVPENAPNYNAIDLPFVFLISDVAGHPEYPARPSIRAMFLRYRDQVSPAGFLPPYGDSGHAPKPFDPAWPMHENWAMFAAAFERAAKLQQDPTLRWAAVQMAATGMAREPLGLTATDVEPLFVFSFAEEWRDKGLQPSRPEAGSAILTRADEHSPTVMDKLVLAASRAAGSPFLLSDLYVRGPHAHENQHGAVTYYEAGGVPLITSTGYNNRQPDYASLPVMWLAADSPDGLPQGYEANHWYEAVLPLSRLPSRKVTGLTVRIESGGGPVSAWAGGFRLIGKDSVDLHWDELHWEDPKGVTFHSKMFDQPIDVSRYTAIAFRWKLSSNKQNARPVILRVTTGDLNTDYHAEALQLEPELTAARVEVSQGRQYGVMEYSNWFTPGTTLRREMVLHADGALLVRDTVTPGPNAKGMKVAPVWQLGPVTEPLKGANSFQADNLLVWFAPAEGQSYGLQTMDIWSKKKHRRVFASRDAEPGKAMVFTTVLLPAGPGSTPEKAADIAAERLTAK